MSEIVYPHFILPLVTMAHYVEASSESVPSSRHVQLSW